MRNPRAFALGVILVLGAQLMACAVGAPAATPPAATIPSATPQVTLAPSARLATPPRSVTTRTPITSTGVITLTLWATEDLVPAALPAGDILRERYAAFSAANPDIRINVVPKKAYGKGGLLDFLLTTSRVVPTQLPDLVTLDLAEVPLAAEAGLLQPLDGLFSPQLKSDFFPFAFQAAHYENQWVAVPFIADVQHLAFMTTLNKPPVTWDDLTKQKTPLLLPLGGDDAFLLQYFSIAPTRADDPPAPFTPDAAATAQVLNFFKRARDLNLLPENTIGLKTSDEVWSSFAAGQAPLAQVSASRYLIEHDKMPNALYAMMPTRDGKTATLATGWAFTVIASDPARQAAAARFTSWFIQGERLAPWLRAAHHLPASRATMPLAVAPADYAAFLREAMERASFVSLASSRNAKVAAAWRTAIAAVWKGQLTPEDAARNVAAAAK